LLCELIQNLSLFLQSLHSTTNTVTILHTCKSSKTKHTLCDNQSAVLTRPNEKPKTFIKQVVPLLYTNVPICEQVHQVNQLITSMPYCNLHCLIVFWTCIADVFLSGGNINFAFNLSHGHELNIGRAIHRSNANRAMPFV
jgi:hypothetical protein